MTMKYLAYLIGIASYLSLMFYILASLLASF